MRTIRLRKLSTVRKNIFGLRSVYLGVSESLQTFGIMELRKNRMSAK